MQFPAPVAAHGEQCQVALRSGAEVAAPHLPKQFVKKGCALADDAANVLAGPVALGQRRIGGAQALAQLRDGCGVQAVAPTALPAVCPKASSVRRVSTSAPSRVTRMVCSHWADSLWSRVTTVQ